MHKEVKFKGPSGFMVEYSFVSHTSDNFHPNEKNKILKSKLESLLFNTRNILGIKQKAFVLSLIKCRTFFGTPGRDLKFSLFYKTLYCFEYLIN